MIAADEGKNPGKLGAPGASVLRRLLALIYLSLANLRGGVARHSGGYPQHTDGMVCVVQRHMGLKARLSPP